MIVRPKVPHEIDGTLGDWAEADDFESAQAAARQLVEDGNPEAVIYRIEGGKRLVVGAATRRGERISLITHQARLTR